MRLNVDGGGYATAQGALRTGNQVTALQCDSLSAKLDAYAGMAGDDSTSADFADSYDAASAEAVRAIADLADSFAGLARLVAASGFNHEAAEAANAGLDSGAVLHDGGSMPDDDYARVSPQQPPSVLGAQPATFDDKRQWILDHVEGFVWPGADTDRLRDAAQTWRTAADGLTDLTTYRGVVSDHLAAQESPEIPLALEAVDELQRLVESTSADLAAIGMSCDAYAAQVEEAHARLHALLNEILQMIVEGIVISVAIGLITGGAGAAAAGGATVARVAAQSPRFHAIVSALRAATAPTAQTVRTTREALRATGARLEKFARVRGQLRTERGAIILPAQRRARDVLGRRGWLTAHEVKDSHSLARHVGKDDRTVVGRFDLHPRIRRSSTFPDQDAAERAIEEAIDRNWADFKRFLEGNEPRHAVQEQLDWVTGRSAERGGQIGDVRGVRVYMVRDADMPYGFRIVTSYPTP